MTVVLNTTITLNPANQIAYLADATGLVAPTEYVVSGTYIQSDTRFVYHGTLDITLTKPPVGVPASNTATAAAVSTVPIPAPTPPPASYPYSFKDRRGAASANYDLELSPGPAPPQSVLGGAGKYKYWVDTSVTPAVLRQCIVTRASVAYVAAEWVIVGAIDGTGFKLGGAGGSLTGNLTVPRIVYSGMPHTNGFSFDWDGTRVHAYVDGVDRGSIPTLPLSIANGGTNATTAAAALINLGGLPSAGGTISGNLTIAGGLTVNGITATGNTTVAAFSASNATINGNFFINGGNTLYMNGTPVLFEGVPNAGNFTILYDNIGGGALYLGGALAYYRQGNHYFQNQSGAATYAQITSVGCFNVSGSWGVISDATLKQDIAPYSRGLEALLALNPVVYRYKPGTPFAAEDAASNLLVGLIADDVKPHIPEMVGEATITIADHDRTVDTLSPSDLLYVMINAVKELTARVAALEGSS